MNLKVRFMFGDKWGKGDTVGCGLTRDGEVFFTLNGHWIAQSPNNISADFCMNYKKNWYCAFNASAPCKVVAKFADFKYFIGSTVPFLVERKMIPKFDKFCMELRDGISPSDLPVIINSNTIQFSENAASNQSLQSNIPITYLQPGNSARRKGFYYFEIVVEHAPEAQSSFFSIGLSVKPHPLQHHIGWNKDSVGYHR